MKILYVVARPIEINASSSVRNRATILGLLKNGHEVDLITTEPDKKHKAYDASLGIKEIKTKYIRLGGIQRASRLSHKVKILNGVKNIVYRYLQRRQIYDNLRSIVDHVSEIEVQGYDLIISSSDPKSSHLFVNKLIDNSNGKFTGKWIQIWGDPFLNDIAANNNKKAALIKKEEERLLLLADMIVYVSRLTCEEQKKLYPNASSKMTYIPIPYMSETITKHYVSGSKIHLVYCGDYNSNVRNIMPLFDAINGLDFAEITICGNSDLTIDSTDNVHIYSRVPFAKVTELHDNADVLVHISNLNGTQIPGKIYQYSGTNQIILFILDGDVEGLKLQFQKYNRYIFAQNTPSSIVDALKKIYTGDTTVSNHPVRDFSKEAIAQTLISRIEEIIK